MSDIFAFITRTIKHAGQSIVFTNFSDRALVMQGRMSLTTEQKLSCYMENMIQSRL